MVLEEVPVETALSLKVQTRTFTHCDAIAFGLWSQQ